MLYSGSIQALFRLYSGSMQALLRLYAGSIQAPFRLYSGSIKPLLLDLSHNGSLKALFKSIDTRLRLH